MLRAMRVEQLISDLGDSDKKRRCFAALMLIKLGEFLLNDLIRIMENPDIEYSYRIAGLLIQIGNPTVGPLIKALDSIPDPTSQQLIIEILGEIGDPRALRPLEAVLLSDNPILVESAIDAISTISCRQLKSILWAN